MFDKTDILARLQNGETAEAIAKEMSDTLNDAISEQKAIEAKRLEEEKALEAKKLEEDRVYAAKREAMCKVIDAVIEFADASKDEEIVAEMQNVDPDKMVRVFDEILELEHSFQQIARLEFPKVDKKVDYNIFRALGELF